MKKEAAGEYGWLVYRCMRCDRSFFGPDFLVHSAKDFLETILREGRAEPIKPHAFHQRYIAHECSDASLGAGELIGIEEVSESEIPERLR